MGDELEKIGIEFRLLIAYLVPGLLFVYSLSLHIPKVYMLLGGDKMVPEGPAVVLIIILSIGAGIFVNAFTWAVIRPIIELTSISRPKLDYSKVNNEKLEAFRVIVDENFRYYQAYSNIFSAFIILICSYLALRKSIDLKYMVPSLAGLIILFVAARDSLKRTYINMANLLIKEVVMTNGVPAPQKKGQKSEENRDNKKTEITQTESPDLRSTKRKERTET
jgi:hypothetical protein